MSSGSAVDPAEIAKFEAAAHRFWDLRGEFRALHHLNPARTEFVATRANLKETAILDVGCGGGLFAEALCRAGGRVTAIDMAPGMIAVARLHAIESGLAIDYQIASAEALLLASAVRYPVVTCMEMLEHVPDPKATITALAQLLAPGGQLFVSTINRNLRSFALAIVGAEYLARLVAPGTHEFERLLRPSELAGWGREAGLDLCELAGLEYNPITEQCRLTANVAVNYLAMFAKPAANA